MVIPSSKQATNYNDVFFLNSVDMLTFLSFFVHLLIKMKTLLFSDGLNSNAARTHCLFQQGRITRMCSVIIYMYL